MSFDPVECWDCPTPLFEALAFVGAAILSLLMGLFLAESRKRGVHVLGGVVLAIVVVWYALLLGGIWKFGISWTPGRRVPPQDLAIWRLSRATDLALVVFWLGTSSLLIVWRRRRRGAIA